MPTDPEDAKILIVMISWPETPERCADRSSSR
jgi:hypothetical protein